MRGCLIGIDGGGSHSRALLVDREDLPLAQTDGPGLNPLALDWDTFRARIGGLLERLRIAAPQAQVAGLCAGLAGAGRETMRQRAEQEIASTTDCPVRVLTDAQIALWGAFQGGPGLLLIAGTGSVCLGMDAQGRQERAGGFGRLLGDEGSGYWIAIQTILRALKEDDQRRTSPLAPAILEQFSLAELRDVVPLVHGSDCPPDCIAALAKPVLALSGSVGAARRIVREAGDHLGGLVINTAGKLRLERPRVALWGGLWQSPGGELQRALQASLQRRKIAATIQPPAEPPEWGAIRCLRSQQ